MEIKKFWKLYPKESKINLIKNLRIVVSKYKRKKIQKFGKEYFDGKRIHGYGGYYYDKKFFSKIAKELVSHYKLDNNSKILDIGCAKGFLMHDIKTIIPRAEILGIDISRYSKINALQNQKKNIKKE